ncbi:hypothetical protein [Calothrix sp. NIES-3974]|uniref:hypothetical protein n=1 Tax=Calothrix sp. NIES-3974 TaxID=2005462 RepID=UPI000B5DCBAB|nr:hypothetical protein [Calothrix sp. NIES-3974]BAZ07785.1 hypothetical protein NIES3974_44500 [Calothrix sp. NIES-3974]
MKPSEIESALSAALEQCEIARCPLTAQQKQILLQAFAQHFQGASSEQNQGDDNNPLDELTRDELEAFFMFVKANETENQSWKVKLLNDWLHQLDSGAVQFIRDRYGLQWLDRIQPHHLLKYQQPAEVQLHIGDRIEVCNALWEWVQESNPSTKEWFSCTVIGLDRVEDGEEAFTSCTIRFPDGAEYQIHGIYEWNRYNWRWSK